MLQMTAGNLENAVNQWSGKMQEISGAWPKSFRKYTLNKRLVEGSHTGIKGGSSLVNHLVD